MTERRRGPKTVMLLDTTPREMYLPRFEFAVRDAFWAFTSFTVAEYACEEFDAKRLGALIVAPNPKSPDEKYEELLAIAGEARVARAIVSNEPPEYLNPGDTTLKPRTRLETLQLSIAYWLLRKM